MKLRSCGLFLGRLRQSFLKSLNAVLAVYLLRIEFLRYQFSGYGLLGAGLGSRELREQERPGRFRGVVRDLTPAKRR